MPLAPPDSCAPHNGSGFWAILVRDLQIAFRHRGELANPLIFFVMVGSLVPLAVGPEPARLADMAPGIIWVMALLASLLSSDGLFQSDYEDGSLEQLLVSSRPLWLLVLAKILAHWLVTGLPLTFFAPLLAVMLSLPTDGYIVLVTGLALGTASLSLIGAIGAALTVTLRKGGLLLSLIVMPLYLPVLIFGANSVSQAVQGFSATGTLAVLGALLAFSLLLSPFAAAGALKIGFNG